MKLVQFKDGSFGIRKLTLWGYVFFDFSTMLYWLSRGSSFFAKDCKRDEYTARKVFSGFHDKGTVVKD